MDISELRTRSVGEQLEAIVSGAPNPEQMIDGIVFESLVRQHILSNPPAEVQMLRFQHRLPFRQTATAPVPAAELSREAVQAIARAAVLLERDSGFFESVILPGVMGGVFASEPTWMALYRGRVWALTPRSRDVRGYTLDRRNAETLAANGIRQLHIAGTVEQLSAAVIDPSKCEQYVSYLVVPKDCYQPLARGGAWASLMEIMARA